MRNTQRPETSSPAAVLQLLVAYREAIKTTSGSRHTSLPAPAPASPSIDLEMFTFIVVGDTAQFLEQKHSYWNANRPTRQAFSPGKSLLGTLRHMTPLYFCSNRQKTNNRLVGQATAAEPLAMDFSIGDRSPSRSSTSRLLKFRLAENDGSPAPAKPMERRRAQKAVNPPKSPNSP